MANDLNANPMFIDTPGGTAVKTGLFRIKSISWTSDDAGSKNIASADQLDVLDSNGDKIVSRLAHSDGDGDTWEFSPPLTVDGISVSTMAGGVLYVYR